MSAACVNLNFPRHWTGDRILAALQEWAVEQGRPPKAAEWAHATPWRPARPTVEKMFGSWNNALQEAGLETRPAQAPGPHKAWSKDLIRDAFLDFTCREGRWPTSTDCGQWRHGKSARVEGLPSWQVIYRYFDSFGAAKRYAGWDGRQKPVVVAEFRCSGCGGDEYSATIGCNACWDRRRHRAKRAAKNGTLHVSAVESLPISDSRASQPERVMAPVERLVDLSTEKAA